MSYTSIRNKRLVEFPNGKLMLLCETSDNNVRDWRGRRCWSKWIMHPKGSLFWTKESLQKEREDYVARQFELLREFNRYEIELGYATEKVEPTLESYDYCGTVWPGGSKIKNGRAFYGGRPIKAEDYFATWEAPKRIRLSTTDKDFNTTWEETYDILREDLDECYVDALNEHGQVWIGIN